MVTINDNEMGMTECRAWSCDIQPGPDEEYWTIDIINTPESQMICYISNSESMYVHMVHDMPFGDGNEIPRDYLVKLIRDAEQARLLAK